jgi:hypothetical protein
MKIHWKPDDVFKKIPRRMLPKEYGGEDGTIKQMVGRYTYKHGTFLRRQALVFHTFTGGNTPATRRLASDLDCHAWLIFARPFAI